ncbi:MAG: ribonuclease [Actinomycetota bacterium]|nr:ribonuclease [Actinomycetota bacterium]
MRRDRSPARGVRPSARVLLAGVLAAGALTLAGCSGASTSPSTSASASHTDDDGIPGCELDDLPATALTTIEDIAAGDPYAYPRNDAGTFGNFEGLLPDEPRGYYREFTVETPGLAHRGARRIVTGGEIEQDPEHWYYTQDHYQSFCEFETG